MFFSLFRLLPNMINNFWACRKSWDPIYLISPSFHFHTILVVAYYFGRLITTFSTLYCHNKTPLFGTSGDPWMNALELLRTSYFWPTRTSWRERASVMSVDRLRTAQYPIPTTLPRHTNTQWATSRMTMHSTNSYFRVPFLKSFHIFWNWSTESIFW